MKTYTSPDVVPENIDLFLAGGITNCPDWQKTVLASLEETNLLIGNPRRVFYSSEVYAQDQIKWEYDALRKSSTVMFWFPEETLCPITLFELGVFTQKPDTKVIVGTHPNYSRRLDVVEQLKLSRPEIKVHDNLQNVINEITKNI